MLAVGGAGDGPWKMQDAPAKRSALSVWLSAGIAAALCLSSALAWADVPRRIPIRFHVAQRDGEAVAPVSFIAAQLAAANTIYRPLGIELVDAEHVPLAAAHAEVVTRDDRDALERYVRKGAVHCFIVAKLMDVDEPGRERRGVHWHPRPRPQNTFLIVSKISKPYVLAHELGHMLGNPQHSDTPGNLMSYAWTVEPPFLDATQIERVQSTLAGLLKSGKLVLLKSGPEAPPTSTP
jgi:hypothetical protein